MSAERDRIVDEMAAEIEHWFEPEYPNDPDGNDLRYVSHQAALAALRVIERPPTTNYLVIKPCTCQHNGYGKHTEGCALYV